MPSSTTTAAGTAQGGQLPYEPYDPYGQQQPPVDPYSGTSPDYYATPDAYPPPQPQHLRQQQQHSSTSSRSIRSSRTRSIRSRRSRTTARATAPATTGGPNRNRASRSRSMRSSRTTATTTTTTTTRVNSAGPAASAVARRTKNGAAARACLVVALVFAGAVGTVGYFGYDFFMAHFGSAPDYEGEGSGDVQVDIPDGSTLSDMGQILQREGVIKSVDAFTEAATATRASRPVRTRCASRCRRPRPSS